MLDHPYARTTSDTTQRVLNRVLSAITKPRTLAMLAVAIASSVAWPFYSVPTGYRGVITTFGKITGIQGEGLAFVAPWQKLSTFNMRAERADIENAEGSTSDQQPVTVDLTVRYAISQDRVADVFEKYSRNGDMSSYVTTATQEAFKAVTANYTAPDLIAKRQAVSNDISAALRTKLAGYGAQVLSIDMRSFAFSQSYMAAINEKVTQEQLRLGAENKLLTVEAEQKQKVAVAQAEADALRAQADGQAYATLTGAKAQAEALRLQSASLAQSQGVLELRRIEVEKARADRWDGKLPQNIYAGTPIPFLNTGK